MEYVHLGKTGLVVSRLCLGCMSYGTPKWRAWVLNEEDARPFFRRAVDAGINFFDTADVYSRGVSEQVAGSALKDFARRDQVVIATKVHGAMGDGPNDRGLSRKHIMASIDASLVRLQTDYVDLYQTHHWDKETPIAETMDALNDVVRAGKARYIGASNMFAWQFAKAQYTADLNRWTRFATMQDHYNLVYREEEREMIPFCVDQGVGMIPWSPLARGFLAGNRKPGGTGDTPRSQNDPYATELYFRDSDFKIVDRVAELAHKRGLKPMQIALAWILHKPGVNAPIIGATKMHHLDEAIAAVDVKLAADEVTYLEELYQPHPVLGHF